MKIELIVDDEPMLKLQGYETFTIHRIMKYDGSGIPKISFKIEIDPGNDDVITEGFEEDG